MVLILGYLIPGPNYPTTLYSFEQSLVQSIDWRLVASLAVAEVPIGVLLWTLLERDRSAVQRTQDAVSRLHSMNEFRHLMVHKVNDWPEADYPLLIYYVVNLNTRKAYYAQETIYLLEKEGIIDSKKWPEKQSLDRFFAMEKITLEAKNPRIEELLTNKSDTLQNPRQQS